MSRTVRMVPAKWEHPKNEKGVFVPLLGYSFEESLKDWDGQEGGRPEPNEHMPDWPQEERTHYQMYETTSEGTPISPPMETPEALANWLADNGASACGDSTATYEQWLCTIERGWAPSAVLVAGKGFVSGVEGMSPKWKTDR